MVKFHGYFTFYRSQQGSFIDVKKINIEIEDLDSPKHKKLKNSVIVQSPQFDMKNDTPSEYVSVLTKRSNTSTVK